MFPSALGGALDTPRSECFSGRVSVEELLEGRDHSVPETHQVNEIGLECAPS